jgi:hypothetical protein
VGKSKSELRQTSSIGKSLYKTSTKEGHVYDAIRLRSLKGVTKHVGQTKRRSFKVFDLDTPAADHLIPPTSSPQQLNSALQNFINQTCPQSQLPVLPPRLPLPPLVERPLLNRLKVPRLPKSKLTTFSRFCTISDASCALRTAKKAAPAGDGDKKKRKRSRKETYSSYIYKG